MIEPQRYLDTLQPELMAMTRLFGLPDEWWNTSVLSCVEQERNGAFFCTCEAQGKTAVRSVPVPSTSDPEKIELHLRRAARRLAKQTLYDLCRQLTGIRPPWGSMTGVRPTHLMLEALREGLSPDEAVHRVVQDFDVSPGKAELLR